MGELGQTRVFQCQGRLHPGCRQRISGRTLSSSAELDGAGFSQTDPLQQACERRALCGLGTTETLYRRGSRGLQIAAYIAGHGMFAIPSAFDLNKIADSFWRVMFNYLAISLLRPADIVCGPPKSNLLADLRYLLVDVAGRLPRSSICKRCSASIAVAFSELRRQPLLRDARSSDL